MAINSITTQIIVEFRIFPNLGLEAIKCEMFRYTKVMDEVIKCLSKTAPCFALSLRYQAENPNLCAPPASV